MSVIPQFLKKRMDKSIDTEKKRKKKEKIKKEKESREAPKI